MNPIAKAKGLKVLVVDDEPRNLQVVGALLRERGMTVAVSTSAVRTLQMAVDGKPDVILLDVMMPDMDGFEVCASLRADPRTAGIPVILLTARTGVEDIVKGFKTGAADYVTKPFRAEELIARVEAHAQLHQLRGLLVICSHCRRIRVDDDHWEQLEKYVSKRTPAKFSHGLCEECLEKYYPEH
jgi:DNA-binding response OmpR family regulator